MKKLILTVAILMIFTVVAISYVAQAKQGTTQVSMDDNEIHNQKIQEEDGKYQEDIEFNKKETEIDGLLEYSLLSKHVDTEKLNPEVVEDNRDKRVILLKDGNGHSKYKSILIKNENRLKIVDFKGGLVFDQKLDSAGMAEGETANTENESTLQTETEIFPESSTISSYVNTEDLKEQVVEDNRNKRIILLKDDNGQLKYKSIFVKNTKRLKIINFDGETIYNEIIS